MKAFLILILIVFCFPAFGQTSELEQAIALYKQERYASASVILEKLKKNDPNNPAVWHYDGLINIKLNDYEAADKALAKAVKLAPNDSTIRTSQGFLFAIQHKHRRAVSALSVAIEIDPKNASALFMRGTVYFWAGSLKNALADADAAVAAGPDRSIGYTLRAEVLLAKAAEGLGDLSGPTRAELDQAVETLEKCLASCRDTDIFADLRERIDAIRKLIDYKSSDEQKAVGPDFRPFRLLFSPRPAYTEDARRSFVEGSVELLVIFNANGTIGGVFVVKPLPAGLSASAMAAARQIRFEPAVRNGKPVTIVKRIVYSFKFY